MYALVLWIVINGQVSMTSLPGFTTKAYCEAAKQQLINDPWKYNDGQQMPTGFMCLQLSPQQPEGNTNK